MLSSHHLRCDEHPFIRDVLNFVLVAFLFGHKSPITNIYFTRIQFIYIMLIFQVNNLPEVRTVFIVKLEIRHQFIAF